MKVKLNLEEFSHEQRKLLESNKHIVVSANAGSGKTYTLVGKIIKLILEGANPERIVVITFTNKAAQELKAKVISKFNSLEPLFADNEEFESLKKEVYKLKISTIHSYCRSILEEFPKEAGLEPNFSSLNKVQKDRIFTEAFRNCLTQYRYVESKSIKGESNFSLINRIISAIGIESFEKKIRTIYEARLKIEQTVYYLEKAEQSLDSFKNDSEYFNKNSETLIKYKANYLEHEDLISHIDFYMAEAGLKRVNKVQTKLIKEFISDTTFLIKSLKDLNGLSNIALYKSIRKFQAYFDDNSGGKKLLKLIIKNEYEDLYNLLNWEIPINIELKYKNEILALIDFTLELEKLIYKEKKNLNLYDEDDWLLKTNYLLENHEVLVKIKENLEYLFIDEFQDTDRIQTSIVKKLINDLSKENELTSAKLCIIGDEKQSIYGFRSADVAIFQEVANELAKSENGGKLDLLLMQDNYRSKENIINKVNGICEELFKVEQSVVLPYSKKLSKINYNPLICKTQSENKGEVYFYKQYSINDNDEVKSSNKETRINDLALLVKSILSSKSLFSDEQLKINIQQKDIAIIAPKRTHFNTIIETFKSIGLNAVTDGKEDIFKELIIKELISFLKFLVHNDDDISLLTILKSHFYNHNENDFIKIRELSPNLSLFECLTEYSIHNSDTLTKTYQNLKFLIEISNKLNITFLLNFIEEKSQLLDICSSLGDDSLDLYYSFKKYLVNIESNENLNLSDIIFYLEDIKESKENLDIERNKEENAVLLTTIHNSKGLEFKCVILYGFSDKFQRNTSSEEAIYLKEVIDDSLEEIPVEKADYESYIDFFLSHQNEISTFEEKKRLLYVALTRAENYLFLPKYLKQQPTNSPYSTLYNIIEDRADIEMFPITNDSIEISNDIKVENSLMLLTDELKDYERNLIYSASRIMKYLDDREDYSKNYLLNKPTFELLDKDFSIGKDIDISSAIEKGNAFHHLMMNIDKWYKLEVDLSIVKANLNSFIDKQNILRDEDIKKEVINLIYKLITTDLFISYKDRIIKAKKEFTINLPINNESYPQLIEDIDDFFKAELDMFIEFENSNQYEVWDWKTNKIQKQDDITRKSEIYNIQMEIYAYMLSKYKPDLESVRTRLIFVDAIDRNNLQYSVERTFTLEELSHFENKFIESILSLKRYESIYSNTLFDIT